jgi:hypothetical protein
MINARIRAADPVVTVDQDCVRFESLSPCSGVYARLDVLADGLDTGFRAFGSTNVDLGPSSRKALAALGRRDPLHLEVGQDHVQLRTLDGSSFERRVPLPTRWLRSFAEIPVAVSSLDERLTMSAAEAKRTLSALPKANARANIWLTGNGRMVRQSMRATPGAIPVPGPERLEALRPLLRHATSVGVFADASGEGCTVWNLELPGMRFQLILSPHVSRGFSGEGGVLKSLATDNDVVVDAITVALSDGATMDLDQLSSAIGHDASAVDEGLTVLGAVGGVGHDVVTGRYYRRNLPLPSLGPEAMSPRLKTARRFVESGAVLVAEGRFEVVSRSVTHVVHPVENGPWECTCTWWAKHHGDRGPCSHVLAAEIADGAAG